MAAIAYATIVDYGNHQLRGSEKNPMLQFRLDSARDKITSCLFSGKYSVSSIHAVIAAGSSYAILKELNIILAHIALIWGGSASSLSDSAGATFTAYKEWTEEVLNDLCAGKVALTDDDGNMIAPPASSSLGICTGSRTVCLDIVEPVHFSKIDPLGIS